MFFKLAQTFFRESLGTLLDKKSVTRRIYAYPTSYGQNQFLTFFFQKSIFGQIRPLLSNLVISLFYTRELQFFNKIRPLLPIFMIVFSQKMTFFSNNFGKDFGNGKHFLAKKRHFQPKKNVIFQLKKRHFSVKKCHFLAKKNDIFQAKNDKFQSKNRHFLAKKQTFFSQKKTTFFSQKTDIFQSKNVLFQPKTQHF